MKNQILLGLALLCLNFTTYAQVDSVNIKYKNKLVAIFENVNLSQVPSGILYEHGFPFIAIEAFNGQITDSSKANSVAFGLAYAAISSMVVNEANDLPDPSEYRDVFDMFSPSSDVIPIAGLHQIYHKLDPFSLDDSLFIMIDSALVDVPERLRSPYLEKELFLFTPIELSASNAAFSFYFDSDLFYNNTGKTVQSLKIDVGNGQGFQPINFDQNIPLTFTESGRHNFKVELKYTDSTVYYSHFDIIVTAKALRGIADAVPDLEHYIGPLSAEEIGTHGRGGGTISVFLACGHERIEKPFIWAEAYNPSIGIIQQNLGNAEILFRMAHPDGQVDSKTLLDYLTQNGYDIVILDYDIGTDYLPRTAEFIKEALRWVNLQKLSAGSKAQNIILGQSMGGVATMQALREMENEEEDHECEKFIIYDSPIRGVNIPLSAQASLMDMSTVWVNRLFADDRHLLEYVEAIQDILKLYYAPATRTMMTEQFGLLNQAGGVNQNIHLIMSSRYGFDTEHLYTAHYDYLHGEMGGMPEKCEVLAMANGSSSPLGYPGGRHNFEAGEVVIEATANNYVVGSIIAGLFANKIEDEDLKDLFDSPVMSAGFGALIWALGNAVNIDIKFYAMQDSEDFKFYSHKSKVRLLGILNLVKHDKWALHDNGLEVDHAPGGFFGLGNQPIFIPDDIEYLEPLEVFELHTWCFTPTGSVLNYFDPLTSETWIDNLHRPYVPFYDIENNLTRGIDSYVANTRNPVFDVDPGTIYKNTAHTWLTTEQSEYMIYNLIGSNELDGITTLNFGTVYNYGFSALTPETDFESSLPIRTSAILVENLTVNGTSFNVNSNEAIGLTPSPYLPETLDNTMANSHFVMYLGPLCNPTPTVNLQLEGGSEMNIGDGDTRTGSVLVQDGHRITVKSGSTLYIKKGSTLKLNYGGLLYVEDGGTIVIEDGGSLITETGSEIHYFDGGAFELNGEYSRLELGGILHLHENADFRPTHAGVNSGIIVINNVDGTLVAETGSEFRIIGDTPTDPLLLINENAKLIVPEEVEQFFIGSCQVLFRSQADFPIQSFTRFVTSNSSYNVQSNLLAEDIHPKIGLFGKSYISNSSFEDVLIYAEEITPIDGSLLVILNSEFDLTYDKSAYIVEMANGNVTMSNCEFNNYSGQAVRLYGLTSYSSIVNSDFVAQPLSDGYGVFKVAENEFVLKGNNFTGGKCGVYNTQGQLSLRCNSFAVMEQCGVFGGYNSRVEMSQNYKQGYNFFDNMEQYNIALFQANFLSISNGYNKFWDGASLPIINGTVTLDLPGALVIPGSKNQWNVSNTAPAASDIEVYTHGTTDEIPYYTNPTMSGTCGTYDPSSPPIVVVDSQGGIYLPHVNLPGFAGMRLDSALAFAVGNTKLWNPSKNDAQAIGYFHAILTKNYTSQELARPETRYFLDQTYAAMKYTLGHAIADSTVLRANNTTSFDTTVQKYVNVLNLLTQEDTFSLANYYKRFALELDKANLYRMLGHTNTGLDILQNISLCPIDSSERAALNELMAIYENEAIKRAIGASAYGVDTVYVNIANYTTPSASQATEFNFGSVINSLSSVNYRTCNSGSLKPEDESNRTTSFLMYPNPSDGVMNLKYEIPSESNAELVVYSMNGQVIYRGNLGDGSNTETIDISKVESGLYFYTVLYNGVYEHAGRISIAH
jgi:hypothetical protein